MTGSFTNSTTQTFNVTHARYLASKVATDLKRIQRYYTNPTDSEISEYETELIELLRNGYLSSVTYGFKKDGSWIEPTVRYTASELSSMYNTDDDPGKIRTGANINGAEFTSFLSYSTAYMNLSAEEKQKFKDSLPFQRVAGVQPGINGQLTQDKNYHSGGTSLNRSSVKSY